MPTYGWIIWTILSAAASVIGVYFAKRWIDIGGSSLIIGAFIIWILGSATYVLALKTQHLVLVEALWTALAPILAIAMGFLVFHEKVSLQQSIGVALAILATALLII